MLPIYIKIKSLDTAFNILAVLTKAKSPLMEYLIPSQFSAQNVQKLRG